MSTITVEARALGRRRPLLDGWSVDIPSLPEDGGEGGLTLRHLIERVVRAEVAAFRTRDRARSLLRVLSDQQIDRAAARGRVEMGGRPSSSDIDEDDAVATALAGFGDGLYLVVLDERELRDLDARVYPREDSRLVFLRLTFLAGA